MKHHIYVILGSEISTILNLLNDDFKILRIPGQALKIQQWLRLTNDVEKQLKYPPSHRSDVKDGTIISSLLEKSENFPMEQVDLDRDGITVIGGRDGTLTGDTFNNSYELLRREVKKTDVGANELIFIDTSVVRYMNKSNVGRSSRKLEETFSTERPDAKKIAMESLPEEYAEALTEINLDDDNAKLAVQRAIEVNEKKMIDNDLQHQIEIRKMSQKITDKDDEIRSLAEECEKQIQEKEEAKLAESSRTAQKMTEVQNELDNIRGKAEDCHREKAEMIEKLENLPGTNPGRKYNPVSDEQFGEAERRKILEAKDQVERKIEYTIGEEISEKYDVDGLDEKVAETVFYGDNKTPRIVEATELIRKRYEMATSGQRKDSGWSKRVTNLKKGSTMLEALRSVESERKEYINIAQNHFEMRRKYLEGLGSKLFDENGEFTEVGENVRKEAIEVAEKKMMENQSSSEESNIDMSIDEKNTTLEAKNGKSSGSIMEMTKLPNLSKLGVEVWDENRINIIEHLGNLLTAFDFKLKGQSTDTKKAVVAQSLPGRYNWIYQHFNAGDQATEKSMIKKIASLLVGDGSAVADKLMQVKRRVNEDVLAFHARLAKMCEFVSEREGKMSYEVVRMKIELLLSTDAKVEFKRKLHALSNAEQTVSRIGTELVKIRQFMGPDRMMVGQRPEKEYLQDEVAQISRRTFQKKKGFSKRNQDNSRKGACFICGSTKHWKKDCPEKKNERKIKKPGNYPKKNFQNRRK